MPRILVFLFLALLVAAPSFVQARDTEITFQLQADESLDQAKKRAIREALAQVALQRALELIPGTLSPERQELLRQSLASHTIGLASKQEEIGLSEGLDGLKLRVDLEVREDVLRRLIERMGVFYTAGVQLPYQLNLTAPGENPQELVKNLELLTGVYASPEAWPHLNLSYANKTWNGGIEAPDGRYDASGSDLPTLWFTLWGWYFTVHGPLPPPNMGPEHGGVELMISGWPAPDGVYNFEHMLRGFQPAVAAATLKSVTMQPTGIAATWELSVRDLESLRQRMDNFCQSRGLVYEITGGEAPVMEVPDGNSTVPQLSPPSSLAAPEPSANATGPINAVTRPKMLQTPPSSQEIAPAPEENPE